MRKTTVQDTVTEAKITTLGSTLKELTKVSLSRLRKSIDYKYHYRRFVIAFGKEHILIYR